MNFSLGLFGFVLTFTYVASATFIEVGSNWWMIPIDKIFFNALMFGLHELMGNLLMGCSKIVTSLFMNIGITVIAFLALSIRALFLLVHKPAHFHKYCHLA